MAGSYFFFLAERRALERFGVDFFRVDFLDFLAIVLFFFRGLTHLRHVSFSEGSPIMRSIAEIVNGGREIIWAHRCPARRRGVRCRAARNQRTNFLCRSNTPAPIRCACSLPPGGMPGATRRCGCGSPLRCPAGPTKFGRRGTRIGMAFVGGGTDDFVGDVGVKPVAQSGRRRLFSRGDLRRNGTSGWPRVRRDSGTRAGGAERCRARRTRRSPRCATPGRRGGWRGRRLPCSGAATRRGWRRPARWWWRSFFPRGQGRARRRAVHRRFPRATPRARPV